jgi:hypothetical protein
MPSKASQEIRALLDKLEPELQAAFLDSISGIKSNVNEALIIARLKEGDIEGAMRAVNIDPAAYRAVGRSIENTFEAGGEVAAKAVPNVTATNGPTALFRFDVGHPTAAADLRRNSSGLITGLVDDQRQAVREALANGIAAGRAPRRTALDIVGRIDPVTKRRTGGIIGLSSQQARYVDSFTQRLLSGDPDEINKVLDMGRRDKRFDAAIRKAIAAGQPLDLATVQKMAARYSDRLLQLRGETIARTETMTAFNKGQLSAMHQAISEGRVSASVVVKVWHAFLDERTRFTHRLLNKKEVGLNEQFVSAHGAHLDHPGDPNAPAEEIVNCRCWMETKIDFLADLD